MDLKLSTSELYDLETRDLKIALGRSKVEVQRERLNLLAKDAEILKLRGEMQKRVVQEAEAAAEAAAEARRRVVKKMAEDRGIEGSWGFDPDTGEILLSKPDDTVSDGSAEG